MKKENNEYLQTSNTILKILDVLETEFKQNKGKTISKDDIFALMSDLLHLFNSFVNLDEKKCFELIKKKIYSFAKTTY